jgi:hydrogenase expression/formation protein HypD
VKHLDEYRDPQLAGALAAAIRDAVTLPWTLMEVCGGQTHSILKSGLEQMLPPEITLVHGPGCPVCVTSAELIDRAVALALRPEVILTSFGDMLRVPGTSLSLFDAKARGGDVRVVYSPLDALRLAQANPQREVVFFAVGFETTAPANAMAVYQASRLGVGNFSILVAHVRVPPAMEAILQAPGCRVQGFLAPGHVCTVQGYREYEGLAAKYRTPIVVTGFEPVDILEGIRMAVLQLQQGRYEVENPYARVVQRDGNPVALRVVSEVFTEVDRDWRGVGVIPLSGLALHPTYRKFDAESRFPFPLAAAASTPTACIAGQVLQGLRKPFDCPAFGTQCTPDRPLGAPMVSSEGACAAYYLYGRSELLTRVPADALSGN